MFSLLIKASHASISYKNSYSFEFMGPGFSGLHPLTHSPIVTETFGILTSTSPQLITILTGFESIRAICSYAAA